MIELYKSDKIDRVICVGGYYYPRWKGRPHLMSRYLIDNGIPPDRVIYDSLSYNTITNCREALKIIESHNIKSVIAVSAPLHIFRISGELKFSNASFASYHYVFLSFKDYWDFFKAVHHEWISNFLSVVLQDEARNRLINIYATIRYNVEKVL
ncbi:MAG: YdcF family protein [Bacteroidales bacterium]